MPPPPRRVPPPARVLTAPPPAPAPTGRPSIRIIPADNLWSILAMTRRAMKDAGRPDHEIGAATDALLKARSGTYPEVAAKYVEVLRG